MIPFHHTRSEFSVLFHGRFVVKRKMFDAPKQATDGRPRCAFGVGHLFCSSLGEIA